MDRLKGRVAAVTGGSAGLGQAICQQFAAEGASVAVGYNSTPDGAEATVKQIRDAGGRAVAIKVDVTRKDDCDRFIAETVKQLGELDIFIANAGIFPRSPFLEIPEKEWHDGIAINLTGAFFASQAAARQMVAQGHGGRILLMSSTAGAQPSDRIAVYGTTKAGMNQMAKCMALELAPHGIIVNVIAPGLIETRITKDMVDTLNAVGVDLPVPLGRFGRPEEIAKLALFLASDDCGYMTGSVVLCDGGYTVMGGLDDVGPKIQQSMARRASTA